MKLQKNTFFSMFYIILGVLSAAIGLKGFLLPNNFFDGGVTGISLLLNHFIHIDLGVLIFLINAPFIVVGHYLISREFAIKVAISILTLALAIHWLQMSALTSDKLLVSIFGGIFLGVGIGLSMRGGSVIDGTEILAIQVSRKSNFSVGDFIAIFNIILFALVASLVDIETAMYSMLTYVTASKSVDFVISGIEEYVGVTIISSKYDLVHRYLVHDLKRGVTIYKTEGGYGKKGGVTKDRKAIFCVVTRLEVTSLIDGVRLIDPESFVIQQSIKDTHGGMIKRRPLR